MKRILLVSSITAILLLVGVAGNAACYLPQHTDTWMAVTNHAIAIFAPNAHLNALMSVREELGGSKFPRPIKILWANRLCAGDQIIIDNRWLHVKKLVAAEASPRAIAGRFPRFVRLTGERYA